MPGSIFNLLEEIVTRDLGAGDYYAEPVAIDHAAYVHQLAETCKFKVSVSS